MLAPRQEEYEERAAIIEYHGGYPREQAERMARAQVYSEETKQ